MTKLVPIIVFLYAAAVLYLYVRQDQFLFFPDDRPFEDCDEMVRQFAKPFDVVQGEQRVRYYFRQEPSANAFLIHFHGNAGSACDRVTFIHGMYGARITFMIVEYPGYSGDTASPSEENFLSNAQAAYDHARTLNNRNLPIVLFGESMGAGVATFVAAENPVRGLILKEPYTSLAAVAQKHYPIFPVKYVMKNQFDATKWAPSVQAPVLALHGTADKTIPIEIAREQILNFPKGRANLIEVEGADHNNLEIVGGERYWTAIKSFVNSVGR